MCLQCLRKMNSELNMDKFTLFVSCNFLVLLSTTVCSQNINKQNVNIADETLTDYSFLRRYHYTKSKNYLKRRYRIRHWIPMFIGTPCTWEYMERQHFQRQGQEEEHSRSSSLQTYDQETSSHPDTVIMLQCCNCNPKKW